MSVSAVKLCLRLASVALAISLGFTASARASELVLNAGGPTLITTGPDTGDFIWNYSLSLGAGTATSGGFFTIYDIQGLVGVVAPANWTATSALTGQTPAFELIAEDATVPNVTFTYSGSNVSAPATFTGFEIISTSDTAVEGQSATQDGGSGSPSRFQGTSGVFVPGPAATPEPSSILTLGTGLLGLAAVARRKLFS